MSEVRQRKGEPSAEVQDTTEKPQSIEDLTADLKAKKEAGEVVNTSSVIHQLLQETMANGAPTIGLSHEAKVYKEQLEKDPFNMELIFNLGNTYANGQQWDKALNVMLRGFKRVSEFEKVEVRFAFLFNLAKSSTMMQKNKQALAVLAEIEEPTGEVEIRRLEVLRCQVYLGNGDTAKGLHALLKASQGQEFAKAGRIWAECIPALKKAGVYDTSRNKLLEMKDSDEATLDGFEELLSMRDSRWKNGGGKPQQSLHIGFKLLFVGLVVMFFCVVLYYMEARGLKKLKAEN